MNSTKRRAGWGLLLGATACLAPTMQAQTGPVLVAQMYAGITVTGVVSATYTIEATTNLALTNGWVVLTNVVLPVSPWVYIDYTSPGIAKRFYRASAMDTYAPSGMALIPAGSFTMGDTLNDSGDYMHTVQMSAFYMDQTEVTKALWDEVCQWATNRPFAFRYDFDNTGSGKGANHPVHTVNWYDMVKWCNARSEKEGRVPAYYISVAQATVYRSGQWEIQNDWVKWTDWQMWKAGYRLPTEAEWEYAARGGLSRKRFPWGDTISHNQANFVSKVDYSYDVSPTRGFHPSYQEGGYPYTSPVGSFAPNGYGLYDMAGNVWEWCWDWFGSYSSDAQADSRGPVSGEVRVIRSGSWWNNAFECRVAFRMTGYPIAKANTRGFRCVLPAGQ